MQGYAALAILLCLVVLVGCQAAETRRADMWWSGVDAFETAAIENSMSAALRKPGRAGGVGINAVFLHPQNAEYSTAEYAPVKVEPAEGHRLFVLGYVGISDGFDWEDEKNPPDGVRFQVGMDDQTLVDITLKESAWKAFVAPLDWAGPREVTMVLKTHPGEANNTSYDWAMFGDPVLVSVDERPLAQGMAVAGVNGVLIVRASGPGGAVTVEGLDARGNPVTDAVASADLSTVPAEGGYASVQFDFGKLADCVQWRWKAADAGALEAWGGSWQPVLGMVSAGPTRAVNFEGEPVKIKVAVPNTGRGAVVPEHGATVTCNGVTKPIERVAAGETAEVEFELADVGRVEVSVRLGDQTGGLSSTNLTSLWPALPELPAARPEQARVTELAPPYLVIENPACRFVVNRKATGLGALAYVWTGGKWELAGSVSPWVEFALDAAGQGSPSFQMVKPVKDEDGAGFDAETTLNAGIVCKLSARLFDDRPGIKVDAELNALRPAKLAAFRGPAVHAGDRSTGAGKGIAIFPGLEYLYGEEKSSSTRDLAPPLNQRWTPHKFKITVPLMVVETRDGGPVLGIAWDATQKWDGENIAPGAAFASPDFLNHQENHFMQLFLPSVPDFVPEHERSAKEPVALEPGKPWKLSQIIVAGVPEPDVTTAYEWFDDMVGYPPPETWARSFEEEVALCRHGFLQSVWDAETNKMRHVVGWSSFNSPGYAALLLTDALGVAEGEDRQRVMAAVNLVGRQTIQQEGEKGLASRAGCHIMGWEFPYHWGHLPGSYAGMRDQAYQALGDQEENGGWGYYPSGDQKMLGEPGTQTSGIVGRNVYTLAKYAAISGDPVVIAGMEKGLKRLREMNVPRGAQGWECPILEPDVLASAYALRACVWAYQATGDAQYLEDARFWARTGLPFQYVWDDGERPGMRYASIPVFGSTFYTHTWIGLPVQWCGLVYAYGLVELMRFDDNPLWRLQVDGMTSSATHQQWPWDSGELTGTYPDSYGNWFTRRNPVYINPEDIVLNVFALHGMDPGLRSQAVETGAGRLHVTAPCDIEASAQGNGLRVQGKYFPSRTVYLSVAPVKPGDGAQVTAAGTALAKTDDLPAGSVGWHWNEALGIVSIGVQTDAEGKLDVTISGFERQEPALPGEQNAWEFDKDTQGWMDSHACTVFQRDGVLRITSTGPDPYCVSGPSAIPARTLKRLTARVRMTAGNAIGLFWRSSTSPAWGPDKEMPVRVPADGEWHEVEWDLSDHPLWSGNIVQLRLDIEPADAPAGTVLDVDWVRPK